MEVKGKIYAIIGDKYSKLEPRKDVYVLGDIDKYADKDKIVEALSMVNLSEDYLLKKSNNLSTTEYNKLVLVKHLINKEEIIPLDHFEKGLCYKEREYFKRLLKKLSKKYGVTFVIKTNDFNFCIDLVDEYYLYEKNKFIKVIDKKDVYKEEVYKYFDKHILINFVLECRKKGHLKDDYYSINEVIKAIYRESV